MTDIIDIHGPREGDKKDPNDFREDPSYINQLDQIVRDAIAPSEQAHDTFDLRCWDVSTYTRGEPPPQEYVVDDLVPRGVPGLIAGLGGVSKTYSLLDLALQVALAGDGSERYWWGHRISHGGRVVMVSGEEDAASIHRRLHALDPDGQRFGCRGRLTVVPVPSLPSGVRFWRRSSQYDAEPISTPQYRDFVEGVSAIEDLSLVIVDPLQALVGGLDISCSPEHGQAVLDFIKPVCAETGAAWLVSHHMGKTPKPIATPDDARSAIRGTTALVDACRVAYAMWHAKPDDTRPICKDIDKIYRPKSIIHGAIVKNNIPVDMRIRTFWQSDQTGVLHDVTHQTGPKRRRREDEPRNRGLIDQIRTYLSNESECERYYTQRRLRETAAVFGVGQRAVSEAVSDAIKRGALRYIADPKGGKDKVLQCVPGGSK